MESGQQFKFKLSVWIDYVTERWMSNSSIFKLLQERGSPWLKSKVLYADHRAIVLNKPTNLVCQLRRLTGDRDTGVCQAAQPS